MKLHHSDFAPAAIGPYSQAVSVGDLVFTSGQVGIDPATGELAAADFEAQARQVMRNLSQVLAAAGCRFADVVRTTIYLSDMSDFPAVNAVYGEALGEHRPARSTVAVASLPKGALVEIDMIARRP